jgi:activating signal cointegrator complex subunit 1
MGKKKDKGAYNDFLDGEKLRDNADVRTSLHSSSSLQRDSTPPAPRREGRDERGGLGKKGKGGPKKPQLTHFLCLPLVNEGSRPQLESALGKFSLILAKENTVPVKAVRPVGTLHLTLGVMSLDEEKLQGAVESLQELDLKSILRSASAAEQQMSIGQQLEGEGLSINLGGLIPMQQPHKTSILYAEPRDTTSRLFPFASSLRNHFTTKGFLIEDSRPLKLHATILNTIYAKPRGRQGNRKKDETPEIQADTADHDDTTSATGSVAGEDAIRAPDSFTAENETASAQRDELDRSEGHGPKAKSWIRFDATSLIEQHIDFVWAENLKIDRVQICKMGAKKTMNEAGEVVDEKYEVVAEKTI